MADACRLSPFSCTVNGAPRLAVPASAFGRPFLLLWSGVGHYDEKPFQPRDVFELARATVEHPSGAELRVVGAAQSLESSSAASPGSPRTPPSGGRALSIVVEHDDGAKASAVDCHLAAREVLKVLADDLGVETLGVSAEDLGGSSGMSGRMGEGMRLASTRSLGGSGSASSIPRPSPPAPLVARVNTGESVVSQSSTASSASTVTFDAALDASSSSTRGSTLSSKGGLRKSLHSPQRSSSGGASFRSSLTIDSDAALTSDAATFREPTPSAKAIFTTEGMKRVSLKRASTIQEVLSGFGPGRPRLRDHFEVLELLGEGGFATVHAAMHKRTGKMTAVKTMLLPLAQDNEANSASSGGASDDGGGSDSGDDQVSVKLSSEERHRKKVREFEFEIKVMERIREALPLHPNIVRLYAVCVEVAPERTCLVMEKMDGGELFERIIQRSHYTEQDACFLFRTLVRAVNALHKDARVIHRDLKPENVLFQDPSHYATVKICDFGTACLIDLPEEDPFREVKIGSPGYTAPEVIQRATYTPACDVWSLGVLLYVLLVGYLPFPDGFMQKLKVITGRFEFPDEDWAGISDDAKDLVKKMLTAQRTQRISATEVLEHPWFARVSDHAPAEKPGQGGNLGDAQKRIKVLSSRRKFKAAALAAVMSARLRFNRAAKDKALEGLANAKLRSQPDKASN